MLTSKSNKTPHTPFTQAVYKATAEIPKGETRTYQQIAAAVGRPKAYRAVGNILNKNRDPKVPCHRVIRSDGKTGGFAWGATEKEKILREEKAL